MAVKRELGFVFCILLSARCVLAAGLPALAQPGISPDGKEIAFVSGGSIWAVPVEGGDAHILVTQSADVSRPIYSPDGQKLAFISQATGNGDIYTVTLQTGELKRLTFDDASDRLDGWSADSRQIFFTTAGHNIGSGISDIYKVSASGGTPMPVVAEQYQNVFYAAPHPDGQALVFCVNGLAASQWWRHGHSHNDECELWVTDGHRHFQQLTAPGSKNIWPTYSTDGRTLYFMSDRDGSENIWSLTVNTPASPPAVQPTQATFSTPTQVTHFHDGRVLWPTLCHDGKTIVFERDFGIWKLDLSTGQASAVPIHLRGIVAQSVPESVTLTHNITEFAVSHDGKKLAFVVQGQVFASPASGGAAVRVTQTDAVESHVAWANDDRRLAYVSTRDGPRHLFLYDFGDKTEKRLTESAGNDSLPVFAPDDSAILFDRDGQELRLVDLAKTATSRPSTQATSRPVTTTTRRLRRLASTRPYRDHLLAGGLSFDRPPFDGGGSPFLWSGAGDWVACITGGPKGFRNVNLIPSDGSARPKQVSFLANTESSSLAWLQDGSSLFFGSGQRTEEAQLARVDLVPQTAKFRDDQFSQLFRERPTRSYPNRNMPHTPQGDGDDDMAGDDGVFPGRPQIEKPSTTQSATSRQSTTQSTQHTQVDFEGIDQRLSLLPVGVDVGEVAVSPDGKYLGFAGALGGKTNVYVYPIDPLVPRPSARQLTDTGGDKSYLQFAPDESGSLRLYYLEGRQIHWTATAAGSSPQDVGITVEIEHDFDREKMLAFDEAWRYLNEIFHDAKFNGVDWKGVRDRFAPYLAGARTGGEERRLLSLMIGELNASHLGAYGGGTGEIRAGVGHLGLVFDPTEYQSNRKLKIATVIPFGPAALSKISAGKYLVSVDGKSAQWPVNLDSLLEHKIQKPVTLGLSDTKDGTPTDVKVTAISSEAERTLMYRAWVNQNRDYVSRISGGRLGYIHIADMSEQALARLSTDLDARNETYDGVVIDVRDNDGGFVNGYALDVFTRKNYLSMQARGFPSITGRAALGQRYLGLPTILVTNRETLSDGEDFTEGYQSQGLGFTVGEPTAGWIIFTSGVTLIDGTQFRIPAETVLDAKGLPMEMHPRPVDFAVSRAVNEPELGIDSQLDEAVKQLDKKLAETRK